MRRGRAVYEQLCQALARFKLCGKWRKSQSTQAQLLNIDNISIKALGLN